MDRSKTAVVVTSIAAPNPVLRALADGAVERGRRFIVIGDVASPPDFELAGCDFHGLDRQTATGLRIAALLPTRHYARKNIGYLLAAREGAEIIVETDDDNLPNEGFWARRERRQYVPLLRDAGWVNVYRYFTGALTWPRGLPLDEIIKAPPPFEGIAVAESDCPIQQGLADGNPDVDAIYRLILPLPLSFRADRRVALGSGAWSPFNSQNTTCWREAFPLLYLPSYCSFRMTDIWRSFVAQRIAWENGWSILYHEPTVSQLRNDHDLMRDFRDEVPGYLHNRTIAERLSALPLKAGTEWLGGNLLACYEELARAGVMESREIPIVEAWCEDWRRIERYTES
jgi:hypothetical protein